MKTRALLLLIPTLVACGGAGAPPPSGDPPLESAKEQVAIGGRSYALEVFLNRDFMPISPPGGRPMLILVRVKAADGNAVDPALQAERLWLIQGSARHETASLEQRVDDAGRLEVVARDGPKWDAGSEADVIVRLSTGGASHLLAARAQSINASH